MPVFRVHGRDRQGEKHHVDVRARGEAVARNTAIRHGLLNTHSVELIPDAQAGDVIEPVVRPRDERARVKLDKGAVLTIAAGVFLGLLAWTVFSILVWTIVWAMIWLVSGR